MCGLVTVSEFVYVYVCGFFTVSVCVRVCACVRACVCGSCCSKCLCCFVTGNVCAVLLH